MKKKNINDNVIREMDRTHTAIRSVIKCLKDKYFIGRTTFCTAEELAVACKTYSGNNSRITPHMVRSLIPVLKECMSEMDTIVDWQMVDTDNKIILKSVKASILDIISCLQKSLRLYKSYKDYAETIVIYEEPKPKVKPIPVETREQAFERIRLQNEYNYAHQQRLEEADLQVECKFLTLTDSVGNEFDGPEY